MMTLLRPTGTAPADVRRADLLPIDKGVPLPAGNHLRRGVIANTLKAMSPGDSFVCERKSKAAVYDNAKKLRIKVVISKIAANKYRVWKAV